MPDTLAALAALGSRAKRDYAFATAPDERLTSLLLFAPEVAPKSGAARSCLRDQCAPTRRSGGRGDSDQDEQDGDEGGYEAHDGCGWVTARERVRKMR